VTADTRVVIGPLRRVVVAVAAVAVVAAVDVDVDAVTAVVIGVVVVAAADRAVAEKLYVDVDVDGALFSMWLSILSLSWCVVLPSLASTKMSPSMAMLLASSLSRLT